MQQVEQQPELAAGSSVALGFFDGIHTGHQAVIGAAVEYAKAHGLAPALFTFTLPLNSTMKGGRLMDETSKHRLMAQLGVQHYIEPAFEAVCSYTPRQFVEEILHRQCRARAVFCGENFTFGKQAAGDIDTLRTLCEPLGIQVVVVSMTTYQCRLVSSTRIRAALAEGDMESIRTMLGRPYSICFPVQHGQGLGRTLGFPTINQIYPAGFAQPRYGIYITRVRIGEDWYAGATGFGTRPTVNQSEEGATCETFIPGFEGQLYDRQLEVEFYHYLAPSQRFNSLQELADCVNNAARKTLEYFAQNPPKQPNRNASFYL